MPVRHHRREARDLDADSAASAYADEVRAVSVLSTIETDIGTCPSERVEVSRFFFPSGHVSVSIRCGATVPDACGLTIFGFSGAPLRCDRPVSPLLGDASAESRG
jgi:hypothetical protein